MSTEQELTIRETSRSVPSDLALPSRYNVQGLVGRGGMGEVYRAFDSELSRSVAIKVLHTDLASTVEGHQRFLREARTLASLSHSNILKIHSFGITGEDKRPYQVSDLLEGESLAEYFARQGVLSIEEFRSVFTGIVDALKLSSSKGIVHRDIKPSNIFLCQGTEGLTPILLDFGIASLEGSDQHKTLTATNSLLGSPSYMSPEQCRGGKISSSSDIYSLGCVMYEALIGRAPYSGETALETMYKHMSETLPKLNAFVSDKAEAMALCSVIQSCLQKDPDRRPATVAILQAELKKALDETPDLIRFCANAPTASRRQTFKRFLPLSCTVLLMVACGSLTVGLHRGWVKDEAKLVFQHRGDGGFVKFEQQVARAQSNFDRSREASDGLLLLQHLERLRDSYWERGRLENALQITTRMIDLLNHLSENMTNKVELCLDQFTLCRQLAWQCSDSVRAAELLQQADENLTMAQSCARPSNKVGSLLVALYGSVRLAESGKITESMRALKVVDDLHRKIGFSLLENAIMADSRGDWRPGRFKDATVQLILTAKCSSPVDALVLCEMLGSQAQCLDSLHEVQTSNKARKYMKTLLSRWFKQPPLEKKSLAIYTAALAEAKKESLAMAPRDVKQFLDSAGRDLNTLNGIAHTNVTASRQ